MNPSSSSRCQIRPALVGCSWSSIFASFLLSGNNTVKSLALALPEMAEAIRDRPAAEPPYQAVCEGILDFGLRHRDMMALVMATEGELEIPLDGRQRPLIDFEDTLAEVLRERYAVPAEDQVSPAVWARASIGALRTALAVAVRDPRAAATPAGGAPGDPLRACFAALQRGNDGPVGRRLR